MRFLVILMFLFGLDLCADRVKETAAVCMSAETIAELREYRDVQKRVKDTLDLELWLMAHDCKIIDKKTEIEVLDYTGKKKEIVKIQLKKTGEVVYGLSKAIQIEQPGQKNVIYKF
jgi:hypothetical protein